MKKIVQVLSTVLMLIPAIEANAQIPRAQSIKTGNANSLYVAPSTTQMVNGKTTNAVIVAVYPTPSSGQFQNFTPSEKAAIEYAVNLWRRILTSAVTINIDFYKDANVPASTLAQGYPGDVRSNFGSTDPRYQTNTLYPLALANKLKGSALTSPVNDIGINVSAGALVGNEFYLGTDGNCPSTKYDLVTIIFHEIGHGLGIISSVNDFGSQIEYKYNGSPLIYDKLLIGNANGSTPNVLLTSLTSPSTALTNFVQSDNIFFNGAAATTANANVKPKIYAPTTYSSGTSGPEETGVNRSLRCQHISQ